MQIVPADQFPGRDLESMVRFLDRCQEQARGEGKAQLVSISLGVKHIEPLAVLDSIFEAEAQHFYLERVDSGEAIAGAEAVVGQSFRGADRMDQALEFSREVLGNTIAIGELDLPFTGPHFFCGFTFADEVDSETRFEPASVFVPRWQVARKGGYYSAVANILIQPHESFRADAMRVWAAHEKFGRFQYQSVPESETLTKLSDVNVSEAGGDGIFLQMVGNALTRIDDREFEKIVLARALDLERSAPYEPLRVLDRLRGKFTGCYAFSFANGKGQSFIGATPERLVKVEQSRVKTMALAGTIQRGADVGSDARLASELLGSEKDLREHQVVIDAIRRRFASMGMDLKTVPPPDLMKLSNVQHLWTPLESELPDGGHLLKVLRALHPTPAVGGSPREATSRAIPGIEPFDRSLYAGALGFFDYRGNGEMVVAIRSAMIDGTLARVYAGSGIVAGSNPEKELAETNLKLEAVLPALKT